MLSVLLSTAFIVGMVRLVMTAVGVGIVSYFGFDLLLTEVYGYVGSAFGSIGGPLGGLVGLAGIDTAVNLILSGLSVRFSLLALKKFQLL